MSDKSYEIVDGVPTYKLFINGEWVTSSRNALDDSINPANGEVFARVQQAGPDEIERAIATSYAAKDAWGDTLASEREKLLLNTIEVIEKRTPEIRDALIDECGSAKTS